MESGSALSSLQITLGLYFAVLGFVVVERLVEMWLSARNASRVRSRGGIEVGQRHYVVMVALHAAFLVSCVVEATVGGAVPHRVLGWLALAAIVVSMALRYWAIASLGDRWNTRVLVEPGREAVHAGPYRFFRHPNYVAVVVEIFALPLIHGAWRTSLIFSVANLLLLRVRIRVEEAALREHCHYDSVFARPR